MDFDFDISLKDEHLEKILSESEKWRELVENGIDMNIKIEDNDGFVEEFVSALEKFEETEDEKLKESYEEQYEDLKEVSE